VEFTSRNNSGSEMPPKVGETPPAIFFSGWYNFLVPRAFSLAFIQKRQAEDFWRPGGMPVDDAV
jgi:hypothetical protein